MISLFHKKKLSTKKFTEDIGSDIFLQRLLAYFDWQISQHEGNKIIFKLKDRFNLEKQEFHFELTTKEFKDLMKIARKLRSRVKVLRGMVNDEIFKN